MKNVKNRQERLYSLIVTALFVAVILVLAFTPIGLIDLPFIKATVLHVPVIIGSVLLGPKRGAALGFVFGLSSLIKNTMTPSALSFAFSPFIPVLGTDKGSAWAVLICFLPRILTGITPYYAVRGFERLFGGKNPVSRTVSLAAAGVLGALTNTLLVMGLIFLIFREQYAAMKGIPVDAVLGVILGVIGANGGPEAALAAVLTPPVCLAAGGKKAKRLFHSRG